jgi:thiamine biosynthesis lipoprotein
MACEHEISVDVDDPRLGDAALAAAADEVRRIEAKYTRYRDDSVTAAINRAAGGAPVPVDEETAGLLRYADSCWRISEGRFDLTSGVLRRAWDFRAAVPRLPSRAEVDALLDLVGWDRVELDGGDAQRPATVRLGRAGMQLDFGGIGKEYAADRCATLLAERGIRHALVNLGGDVRAAGGQAGGAPWRIGIQHPRGAPGAALASIEVGDGAVATSGDYERFFEMGGRRYCHLLDARTGWPVEAWQSISVRAPLAVVAGSLASIAMLHGEEAPRFLAAEGAAWLGVDARGALHGTLG